MQWSLSAFSDEAGPSCQEQIRALQRAGLRFMDLRSVDGFNIAALPLEQARLVRQKLDAAGICVNMFGSPIGKLDLAEDMAIDMEKLRHLGELAPILGCNAVRMFSYYSRKAKLPPVDFQDQAMDRLRQLKRLARELGLVLYLENEVDLLGCKPHDMREIARQMRDETFRIIFDFGNYNAVREDVWQGWLMLHETTDALHLKDNLFTNGTMHHVPVGEGQGSVKRILADAVQRRWQGPVTVEAHLQHSAAVAATGPSGEANQAFARMPLSESFHIACQAAKELIGSVGGPRCEDTIVMKPEARRSDEVTNRRQ